MLLQKSNTLHLFKVSQLVLSVNYKIFPPLSESFETYINDFRARIPYHLSLCFKSSHPPWYVLSILPMHCAFKELLHACSVHGLRQFHMYVCVSGSTKLIFAFMRLWRQFPDIQEVVLTWWGGEGSGENTTFVWWPCVNFVMPQILGLELASFWRFN